MSWRIEWNSISNRINGLLEAGNFLFLTTRDTSTENRAVFKNVLMPQLETLRQIVQAFLDVWRSSVSPAAVECIERFLEKSRSLCDQDWAKLHNVQTTFTLLASFRAELSYHLSDMQAVSQRLSERAFIHLQRSIIADSHIRGRWKKAFRSGEPSCEKLGAAHLLGHGIWCFKASAEGERTDLILGEPLRDLHQIESAAEALVLTEWKIVRDPIKEVGKKSADALKQARRYSSGILAGFELTTYRYLVIVSEGVLEMPEDINENELIYRHINIAVDPATPSKS